MHIIVPEHIYASFSLLSLCILLIIIGIFGTNLLYPLFKIPMVRVFIFLIIGLQILFAIYYFDRASTIVAQDQTHYPRSMLVPQD